MRKLTLLITSLLCYVGVLHAAEAKVATLAELQAALAADNELPIIITAQIEIPAGETVELDLKGKTVTVPEDAKHIYALNNKGTLTIKDSNGNGSISARGIYNGYDGVSSNNTVEGAKLIIESGKFIALDSDGGAAILNCAELVINDGTFKGIVAAVNNRAKGVATINGGTFAGGYDGGKSTNYIIQNNGGSLTINDANVVSGFGAVGCYSGKTIINGGSFLPTGWEGYTCHVVYVAGAADVTINGGTFKMNYPADATPDSGSAVASYYNGTLSITGGSFTAHFDNVSPVELSDGSVITGGSYYNHSGVASTHIWVTNFIKDGYELGEDGKVTSSTAEPALAGEGTEASPYLIASLDDLKFFRDKVNADDKKYNAAGVYFELADDIDMTGENWVGIGSINADHGFMGNFDGKNFVVKNLTINNPALVGGYAYAGLFSITEGTDNNQNFIKNLTIENVTINTTGQIVSAAIAYPYYTIIENVKVCGNIAITGGDYTAGVLAYTRRCVNASNITVAGNEGSSIAGAQVVGGVISDIQMNGGLTAEYANFSASGVSVSGTKMVGGISGIICKQILNGASVKNVTLNCSNASVGIVSGSWGDVSTISNVTVENVSGATAIIGATWKEGAAVEAKLGDTYYSTFAAAYKAAQAGDVITLLTDIEASDVILLDKSITINGNDHKVTSSANRVFRVTVKDTEVTLNNVNMVSNAKVVYPSDIRGISIDDVTGVKLTLNNCSVDFTDASATDWSYAVNVVGGSGHVVTVNGGTYEGANVINVRGTSQKVSVENAILTSLYVDNEVYYGACIYVIQDKNSSVNAKGNTFNGTNAVAFNVGYTPVDESDNTDNTKRYISRLKGEGTEAAPYLISNKDELVFFRNSVNEGETKYSAPGVWVALNADIDLAGINWVGIGSMTAEHGFMGNFDGKTFKIKNLTIDSPALDSDGYAYAGFFSLTEGTDKNNQNVVKNLTIENVTINTTGHIAAAAIAYAYYTIVEDVTVCGDIAIKGGDYTAGALAYTRRCVNASNITVAGNEGSSIAGAQVVGGVISDIQTNGGLKAEYANFSASGVSVSGTKMVGGISGIICEQTLNGASVKNVALTSGDSRVGIVSGSLGGVSTIIDATYADVTGATAIVGATYDGGAKVPAKIGDVYYTTLAAALAAEGDDVVDLLTALTLSDTEDYTFNKAVRGDVTYERMLSKAGEWMPLYVPFAISMSEEFLKNYDIAYFNDVHSFDEDEDNVIERTTIELIKVTNPNATLKANYPLVIRAKSEEARALKFSMEGVTLAKAVENSVTCNSVSYDYVIKGSYQICETLADNQRVMGKSNVTGKYEWVKMASGYSLNPYRLILTITSRGNENLPFESISMRVVGEEGEDGTTQIYDVEVDAEQTFDGIFDLQGRRVLEPQKGGLYIINGKKVVVK